MEEGHKMHYFCRYYNTKNIKEMVRLIESTQTALTGFKADSVTAADSKPLETPLATPKWVTPMLLFIDLYEKVKPKIIKNISYYKNFIISLP